MLHGDYALAAPRSWQTRELSTRSRGGDLVLQAGERCLASDGTLGDCAAAARWTTTPHGELAGPAGCLAPGGLAPCDGTHALFVLDDGQIRAGAECLTATLAAADCAARSLRTATLPASRRRPALATSVARSRAAARSCR